MASVDERLEALNDRIEHRILEITRKERRLTSLASQFTRTSLQLAAGQALAVFTPRRMVATICAAFAGGFVAQLVMALVLYHR